MGINTFLKIAVDKKASDLHLVANLPPVLRINGELVNMDNEKPISKKMIEQMVLSMLAQEQKEKFANNLELDFGYEIQEQKARFRINLHYEKGNIGLVARVINEKMPAMEEIGMPEVIYNLLNLKQGLILVTGPTGCGKSTTLAAMINYINSNRRCNIITLEDPIEYLFEPNKSIIIQRQLGSDMRSFAEGLKHILRQDPDVVMVGEMRDLETIATTITLAETGHLVLATLHTYSAAQTVDRIIDIFPPHQQNQIRLQLSMILACILSQRLLPDLGGDRVACREILLNIPAVANLIRENKITQIKTVIETNLKKGMISMDQNIKELYRNGKISLEIAQSQMSNPELLERIKK